MAEPTKAMTLRLPADLADALAIVASVDEQSVADVVRQAVADYVADRRTSESFRRKLAASIDRATTFLNEGA